MPHPARTWLASGLLLLTAAAGGVFVLALRGPDLRRPGPAVAPVGAPTPVPSDKATGVEVAGQRPAGVEREPSAPDSPARRSAALKAAVGWLAQAQEADGSYDLARWNPWHGKTGLFGFTEEDHWFAPAATALVALALLEAGPLAAGHDAVLVKALERLLAWQRADGRIGLEEAEVDAWFRERFHAPGLGAADGPGYKALTIHTFNHAVPAAALARALTRPDAARWREPATRALDHLVADEHPEYRWSAYLDPESDLGVAAYVALAASAGAAAGLEAHSRPLLQALPDFLDRVTDPATGRTQMLADLPACFEGEDSTAINAYCRRLAGQDPQKAPLRLTLAALCRVPPAWRPAVLPPADGVGAFARHLGPVVNHDAFTYAVLALTDVPGARAPLQREAIRRLLIEHQVTGGEHAGSWEPIGVWDRVGGRLYATAMAVRALAPP